jgi:hypothetical protein
MILDRSLVLLAVTLTALGLAGCSASAEDGAPDLGSEEDDVRARTTTLTFPLIGRERISAGNYAKVPLESLNAQLSAAGLGTFEKSITIGRNDKAKFEAVVAKLDAANAKLGREIEFRSDWDPSDYVGLCYNGTAAGVMKTVEANRGSAFPTYMGVQAERYGSRKKTHYGDEGEWLDGYREDNAESVKVWEDFDTRSDAFLFIADGGQQGDGTEFFPVLVPKCR